MMYDRGRYNNLLAVVNVYYYSYNTRDCFESEQPCRML